MLSLSARNIASLTRQWILLTCLWFSFGSQASTLMDLAVPIFDKVGKEGDIPWETVMSVTQDHQGFLWIGTQKGLIRYDGYTFHRLNHQLTQDNSLAANLSLVDNFVRHLTTTSAGQLVIATQAHGLSIYDPHSGQFTHYQHHRDDPDTLVSHKINVLAADSQGGVYIGTRQGLDYLGPDGRIHHLNQFYISELYLDRDDTLWMGTKQGVYQLTITGDLHRAANLTPDPNAENEVVTEMFIDTKNNLWIAHRTGNISVHTPDGAVEVFKTGYNPRFNGITQVGDNQVWLSSYSTKLGILIIDIDTKKVIKEVSVNGENSIKNMFVDKSGLLWIGTAGTGLFKYNTRNQAFYNIHQSKNNAPGTTRLKAINNIAVLTNGDLLLGTRGQGIFHYQQDLAAIEPYQAITPHPSIANGIITSLIQSRDGAIWLGVLDQGIYRVMPGSHQTQHYHHPQGITTNWVSMLLETNNKIWMATTNGLYSLDPANGHVHHFQKLAGIKIITLLAEPLSNTLWIGTENGLFTLAMTSGKLSSAGNQPLEQGGLAGDIITGLLIDQEQQLWVDTTKGLHRLTQHNHQQAAFEHVNNQLALFNEQVFGNMLLDDEGRIWGDEGVLDPRQPLTADSFNKLDRSNGIDLGTNWIGAYDITAEGHLLFGGARGLLVIDPQQHRSRSFDPQVVITQVMVDNQLHSRSQPLKLNPEQQGFSVEFSALDFAAPLKNRYAYRLTGYQDEWIETPASNRLINFTNLDPGKYQLEIKGSNSSGHWSSKTIAYEVTVLPNWYQTPWFYASASIFLLLFLNFIHLWRVRFITGRKEELEALVCQRTAELSSLAQKMELLATTDELSQIPNRRHIMDIFAKEFSLARRHHLPLVVLEFDIDHFKNVNDHCGHYAGDEVIKAVARIGMTLLREEDAIGRVGGEEFLVILPLTRSSDGVVIAQRFRETIEQLDFSSVGITWPITVSIGVAALTEEHDDKSALLIDADMALYQAKKRGRNRVELATSDQRPVAEH